ncbi:MAG TPA: hypothetical protein ENG63_03285 [Candidatus Desulfofervidus auxilii]|uniref:Universal stress protein n=1 Tax=Desulfofervidus auxilii TaxID=1621989 RepID=A0A7C0Y533_DESA2|nr:hypothetical protein [Candidatus Desulfofervidus auxilii]
MERVLFLEQDADERSPTLNCVMEIVRKRKCELKCIFLVPVSLEITDWIQVQEKQIKEATARAEGVARKFQEKLTSEGLKFSWKVIPFTPSAFIESVQEMLPVNVIITGKLNLDPLAEKGIKHLEDLSVYFSCPVLPARSLIKEKGSNGRILSRMLLFGTGAAGIYFGFFPLLEKFNKVLYMKGGVLGALAVMLTVPIVAYTYGSFTECIPKLLGLEKTAGH